MIISSEVLRRRLSILLADIETLPAPESIINMEPLERAETLSKSWNLRWRFDKLYDDIADKNRRDSYSGQLWADVTIAAGELYQSIRRYDWLLNEFYIYSQNDLAQRVSAVREADDERHRLHNPKPVL